MEGLESWKKAGRLAGEARDFGASLVKEGALLLDVALEIEKFIAKKGAIPGFPVQLSLNEMAAHYTPYPDDKTVFSVGDLVKLDLGVQVDGFVGDTAITIEVGTKEKQKLVQVSKDALLNAIKILRPGVQIGEIGQVVEETITKAGFEPIRNLCGHGIQQFVLHAEPSIPNYNNRSKETLEEGQVIAIEPFASTGIGMVKEGRGSSNFRLVSAKPVRDPFARKVVEHIKATYSTLPFSQRALAQVFERQKVALAIGSLVRNGNVVEYAQLPEQSGGLVSQHEHTILIAQKPIVLTKTDD